MDSLSFNVVHIKFGLGKHFAKQTTKVITNCISSSSSGRGSCTECGLLHRMVFNGKHMFEYENTLLVFLF